MHKVFISYHHENDQWAKEKLLAINEVHKIFIDQSVNTGDISDDLSDQEIREKIRDEHLEDSTVTILLVGIETKNRKHIDWELYSSMINGKINKKSGILVVMLPSVNCNYYTAAHEGEKEKIYPEQINWTTITLRSTYEERYSYLPNRIIDNLLKSDVKISVVNWDRVNNCPENLKFLIEATFLDKESGQYDLSRNMKRKNS